jgi:hypothetical protein
VVDVGENLQVEQLALIFVPPWMQEEEKRSKIIRKIFYERRWNIIMID